MPTTRRDLRAAEAYRVRTRRILTRGAGSLAALWAALDADDLSAAEGRFAESASEILASLGLASGRLTSGYLAFLLGDLDLDPTDVSLTQDLRHPFIGVYNALAKGRSIDAALEVGRTRAAGLAGERVIQTQREVAARADTDQRIVGWRRVPQGSTCKWCITVSTQRYHTARSASFGHGHGGVDYCDCDVVPIVGDRDPGRVINRPLLRAANANERAENPSAYLDADTGAPTSRPGTETPTA